MGSTSHILSVHKEKCEYWKLLLNQLVKYMWSGNTILIKPNTLNYTHNPEPVNLCSFTPVSNKCSLNKWISKYHFETIKKFIINLLRQSIKAFSSQSLLNFKDKLGLKNLHLICSLETGNLFSEYIKYMFPNNFMQLHYIQLVTSFSVLSNNFYIFTIALISLGHLFS